MRRYLVFLSLITALLCAGEGRGVTSRVRISVDESNKNWETFFFGDRLKAFTRGAQTDADEGQSDEDSLVPLPETSSSLRKKETSKRKTVEYHIIQESSEGGNSVRKVKKRIVTDIPSPANANPEQRR